MQLLNYCMPNAFEFISIISSVLRSPNHIAFQQIKRESFIILGCLQFNFLECTWNTRLWFRIVCSTRKFERYWRTGMTPMQWHRHWHAVTPPMNTLQPTKASQWIAHTTIRLARNNLQESPARSNSAPLISIQVLGTDMKTCSGLCNTLMWMLAYSWKSISLATSTCPGNVATTFWYLKLQGSTYQGGVALFWWYSQIPTSWQLKDPNMASGSWHLAIQDGWLLVPTYPPAFDYQPFIDLINMGTGWPPSFWATRRAFQLVGVDL